MTFLLTCFQFKVSPGLRRRLLFIIIAFMAMNITAAGTPADTLEWKLKNALDEGRVVDNLGAGFSGSPSGEFVLLPSSGDFRYGILIYNIDIYSDRAEFSAGMAFRDSRSNRLVGFAAHNVRFYYNQGLTGAVRLILLNSLQFSLGRAVSLEFYGGLTGCQALMGCNGLEEFTLAGHLEVWNDVIYPLDGNLNAIPDSSIRCQFRVTSRDWNSWLAALSFPVFGVKGMKDYAFELQHVVLDMSEERNDPGFIFHPGDADYLNSVAGAESWEGLFLGKGSVWLPAYLSQDGKRVNVGVQHFYIDYRGLSGTVFGENVLSADKASIGGWAISIDRFTLSFLKNGIQEASFNGKLGLPVLPDTQLLRYTAIFNTEDEYLFSVGLNDRLIMPAFRVTKIELDPVSRVDVSVIKGDVSLSALLTGRMSLLQKSGGSGADAGAEFSGLVFQEFRIANKIPRFNVRHLGVENGGEGRANGFPVYLDAAYFRTETDLAIFTFDLGLNLHEKISADGSLEVHARMVKSGNRDRLQFERLKLNELSLDARFSVFRFAGSLAFIRRDNIYGDGFSGKVSFSAELNPGYVQGGTMILFGQVDGRRYWYFDAELNLSHGVPVSPGVSVNGFLGGAWHGMRALRAGEAVPAGNWGRSSTGRIYLPDQNAGIGLRAGVYLQSTGKGAFQSNAVLEMQFFKGGGLDRLLFYGAADFMTAGAVPSMSEIKSLTADQCKYEQASDFVSGYQPKGKIAAALMMELDFTNKVYFGDIGVYVSNGSAGIRGTGRNGYAGKISLYFSPTDWYVWIGNTQKYISLQASAGNLLNLSLGTYFMTGTRVLPPAALPYSVTSLLGKSIPDPVRDDQSVSQGVAFAFGGNMNLTAGAEYRQGAWKLYARATGEAGFDVNMKRISSVYACKSTGQTPGVDGWYADGRWYAGMNIRLGGAFRNFTVDVANLSAGAIFTGQAPDPTYGAANVRIRVKLAFAQLDAGMNFEWGTPCELIQSKLAEADFISMRQPLNGSRDVSTLVQPEITYALSVNRAFSDASGRELRFFAEQPRISSVRVPAGQWNSDTTGTMTIFTPETPFTANTRVDIYCRVLLQARNIRNGQWENLLQNGKPVAEEKTFVFQTGAAAQNIPLSNVAEAWPAPAQVNFYRSVTDKGIIRLKTAQTELFNVTGTRVVVRFTSSQPGEIHESEATAKSRDISFRIPASLSGGRVYRIRLVRQASSIPLQNSTGSVQQLVPSGSTSSMTQGKTGMNQSVPVLLYQSIFRCAPESIPERQWAHMRQDSAVFSRSNSVLSAGFSNAANQYFEPAEWAVPPRIVPGVQLTASTWFSGKVSPVVYSVYAGLSSRERSMIRFSRDTGLTGLIPARALNFSQKMLTQTVLEEKHFASVPFSFGDRSAGFSYRGLPLMRSDMEDIRKGLIAYIMADPAADLRRLSMLIPASSATSSPAMAAGWAPAPVSAVPATVATMPPGMLPVAVLGVVPPSFARTTSSASLRNQLISRIQGLGFPDPAGGEVFPIRAIYRYPGGELRNISMWRMHCP